MFRKTPKMLVRSLSFDWSICQESVVNKPIGTKYPCSDRPYVDSSELILVHLSICMHQGLLSLNTLKGTVLAKQFRDDVLADSFTLWHKRSVHYVPSLLCQNTHPKISTSFMMWLLLSCKATSKLQHSCLDTMQQILKFTSSLLLLLHLLIVVKQ